MLSGQRPFVARSTAELIQHTHSGASSSAKSKGRFPETGSIGAKVLRKSEPVDTRRGGVEGRVERGPSRLGGVSLQRRPRSNDVIAAVPAREVEAC